jgi:hypothetical protein
MEDKYNKGMAINTSFGSRKQCTSISEDQTDRQQQLATWRENSRFHRVLRKGLKSNVLKVQTLQALRDN